MRRRRQKTMVGASRQWFVSGDLWVAGTAAAAVGEGIPQAEPEVSNPSYMHTAASPMCCIDPCLLDTVIQKQIKTSSFRNMITFMTGLE